jgi:hypothetical protein
MRNRKYFTCILTLLLVSCSQDTTNNIEVETVHFAKKKIKPCLK